MERLSSRERDLLSALQHGLELEVAAKLVDMAPGTARRHVADIHRKYGVKSTAAAVAVGIREGDLDKPRGRRRNVVLELREMGALRDIANDREDSEIGSRRHRTRNTSKEWVGRLLDKLRAQNRTHAVYLGYLHGLLE